MKTGYILSLTMLCTTPEELLRAQEAAGRMAVGLAIDGLMVQSSMSTADLEEYCEEGP